MKPIILTLLLLTILLGRPAVGGEIQNAARAGDLDKVKALLADKPDLVNNKDDFGVTALHWAALMDRKNVVALLLASKANVNARDNEGITPLLSATFNTNQDVVELLLANHADVNARDHHGTTPLHEAALTGSKDVTELLLANQAKINAKDNDGVTPLLAAMFNGHPDVAELLRQHGGQEIEVAKQMENNGLVFSVQSLIDKDKLKRIYKVNLTARGVLAVKVKLENLNPTETFIIAKEDVLVLNDQFAATNSARPFDIAYDLFNRHVTKGTQMAEATGQAIVASLELPVISLPIFLIIGAVAPVPGDVIDKMDEFRITGNQFYTHTLDPGQRAEGIVYFRLPKKGIPLGPFHLLAQARNSLTGQIIPFDIKLDLDFKSP